MANTIARLKELQALPLEIKIAITKQRIREWIGYYGVDGVYVSFSGGKDSTVLLDIVRQEYPHVQAVFADTGLEYPEIRDFVKTFDNVVFVKPKMNFRQVIEKYGYPFISKEVSNCVYQSVRWLEKHDVERPYKDNAIKEKNNGMPYRLAQLLGIYEINWGKKKKTHEFNENELSAPYFQKKKWAFLLDAPFVIGSNCCDVMKKRPCKEYEKRTGRVGITAQMACESGLRERNWLKNGCNAFTQKRPMSNPMSFWTEQDVLHYIKKYNLRIAEVYGDIVVKDANGISGQACIAELADDENVNLMTTGCHRTGCIFCGYGCHNEKGKGRFELLKITHPKIYEYIMKPVARGGLGYKEIIDWLNENGNLHIKY